MLSFLLRPLMLTLLALLPLPLWANPAALCDQAAQIAADQTGVPLAVLQALTRAETGRGRNGRLEPWPWSVNQAGEGHWFNSAAEAEDFVSTQLANGYSNLDIGCFQLNHRWHGEGFSSLSSMFRPGENALYAAQYIAEKYREKGDWTLAAGAYHSGTEQHATRYARRFEQILADLGTGAPGPVDPGNSAWAAWDAPEGGADPVLHLADLMPEDPPPRPNRFPLLMAGQAAGGQGSLVPRTGGMGSLFARVP